MEHETYEEEPEPWYKGPIKIILAAFLVLLLILWYFPSQAVKVDPEPHYIPSIEEVLPQNLDYSPSDIELLSQRDYLKYIEPNDPQVKFIADSIVSKSCDGSKVCHAKAIYYFVTNNFQYVSDPTSFEYVKTAKESLATGVGDCDDASVTLSNLLQAVGIRTKFVFIPGHVYVMAHVPEALKRYKIEDSDYVSLDPTCQGCKFGELPYSDFTENKVVVG